MCWFYILNIYIAGIFITNFVFYVLMIIRCNGDEEEAYKGMFHRGTHGEPSLATQSFFWFSLMPALVFIVIYYVAIISLFPTKKIAKFIYVRFIK